MLRRAERLCLGRLCDCQSAGKVRESVVGYQKGVTLSDICVCASYLCGLLAPTATGWRAQRLCTSSVSREPSGRVPPLLSTVTRVSGHRECYARRAEALLERRS